jgi:hypothetical protein
MSLLLLKILGHEIALSEWEDDSKDVIWTAAVLAFFGSLRFGEMLGTGEWKYKPYETLLWSDIKFSTNQHCYTSKSLKTVQSSVNLWTYFHSQVTAAALLPLS